MAKKGGAVKLQEEINSDEELDRFFEKEGLLVLDIYSEWCGPCLGMIMTLRKLKLEFGAELLHYAICKTDTIEYLKRFRNKSEPTWLFVTAGKVVNIMFGTNVPDLIAMVTSEIALLGAKNRHTYEIYEDLPKELEKRRAKDEAAAEMERIKRETEERKREEYLMYCTDAIIENLPDIGVTIFGPQVNRDTFKKMQEPADSLHIQCKDRKMVEITREQMETAYFHCTNPIEEDVLEQLMAGEVLICFWKLPGDGKQIPKLLHDYAKILMSAKHVRQPVADNEDEEEEVEIPAILQPLDLKVEFELKENEKCIPIVPTPSPSPRASELNAAEEIVTETEQENKENEEATAEMDMPPMFDISMGLGDEIEDEAGELEEEVIEELVPQKQMCVKRVRIPPIWIADNYRTHAALIYTFFRNQTTGFLPPDPVPKPPHIIMAFETYKKRDLVLHAKRFRDEIPAYGFFTSDDPEEAEYIANSLETYKRHSAGDKLILKVNKATSHTMLNLVTYGPTYVSPNTTEGFKEALKLFPETYMTAEEEEEQRELEAKKQDADKKPTDKRKSAEQKKSEKKPSVVEEAEDETQLPAEIEDANVIRTSDAEQTSATEGTALESSDNNANANGEAAAAPAA